jgi:hypothetical protein
MCMFACSKNLCLRATASTSNIRFFVYSFIKVCGTELTCLRLACCRFVDGSALSAIAASCSNLEGFYLLLPCNNVKLNYCLHAGQRCAVSKQ